MFDQQDCNATICYAPYQSQRTVNLRRIETSIDLVEHQHFGIHGETFCKLKTLTSGDSETGSRKIGKTGEFSKLQLFARDVHRRFYISATSAMAEQGAGRNILEYGHAWKRLHDLKCAS